MSLFFFINCLMNIDIIWQLPLPVFFRQRFFYVYSFPDLFMFINTTKRGFK